MPTKAEKPAASTMDDAVMLTCQPANCPTAQVAMAPISTPMAPPIRLSVTASIRRLMGICVRARQSSTTERVSGVDTNQQTIAVTREFIRGYAPVQQYLDKQFSNTGAFQKELEQAFRYVKHYFPQYKTSNAIFFTGPFDAPGVANTNNGFAFGLQQYAGKDFKEYQAPEFQEMFPTYISRRFSKEYMVANCMKSVADDIFPDRSAGKPLIEQMIEKGKQWYLLDKFLPKTPDSLKTGFTQKQLEWCAANEGMIWSYIVKNEDLNSLSPAVIQVYIGEAPFTQGMPQDASPGNLGQWIGWQIVKKFVSKNSKLSIEEVMRTAPAVINEQAKYKPK